MNDDPAPKAESPQTLSDAERVVLIVVIACCVTVALGFLLKGRCLDPTAFASGDQYRRLCYNDIQPLYGIRDVHTDTFPYVNAEFTGDFQYVNGGLEYPVLTGVFMWLAGLLVNDADSYLRVNALLMAPMALVGAYLLARMAGWRALLYACAAPIVWYAFHNWDVPSVAATIAGLWSWHRGKPLWAAVWFGIGGALKLHPVLFIVPLVFDEFVRHRGNSRNGDSPTAAIFTTLAVVLLGFLYILVPSQFIRWLLIVAVALGIGILLIYGARYLVRGRHREAARTLTIGAGTWLAINLPFMLINYDGWWGTYEFHRLRPPNPDSMFALLGSRFPDVAFFHMPTLNLTVAVLTLATFVVVLAYAWDKGRREAAYPFLQVCAAFLSAFMLWNKVFSPQYMLWLVPFFVVLNVHLLWWVAFIVIDAISYSSIFRWLYDISYLGVDDTVAKSAMITGIWARAVLLAALIVVFLRSRAAPTPESDDARFFLSHPSSKVTKVGVAEA